MFFLWHLTFSCSFLKCQLIMFPICTIFPLYCTHCFPSFRTAAHGYTDFFFWNIIKHINLFFVFSLEGFIFNRFESDKQKLLNMTDFISCHYCLAANQYIFNKNLALFICHPPSFLYTRDKQFELHNKRQQNDQIYHLLSINYTLYICACWSLHQGTD